MKNLTISQLQQKLAQNKQAVDALSGAGITVPTILSEEINEIESLILSRAGEVKMEKLFPAIEAYIAKEHQKEPFTAPLSFTVTVTLVEGGNVEIDGKVVKARTSSSASTGAPGTKGRKVIMNGNEYDSAAKALAHLKESGVVEQDYGTGNSAVRVLRELEKKGVVASLEIPE